MSEAARVDLTKQVERAQVDMQRATQDAQAEVQELQQQLQEEFQRRIAPIIEAVGKEKGLHYIFNGPDSGLVWADAVARHHRRSGQEVRRRQQGGAGGRAQATRPVDGLPRTARPPADGGRVALSASSPHA